MPINKLFAFGSDQFTPLLYYASAETVRDLISEVLTELIEEKRLSEKDALLLLNVFYVRMLWIIIKWKIEFKNTNS